MKQNRSNNHIQHLGFSLLEMAVVIAICSTIIFLSPMIMRQLQRKGVVHAVEQLCSDLQLARLAAISKKKHSTVSFDMEGSQCYAIPLARRTIQLSQYRGGVVFLPEGPDGKTMTKRIRFNRQGMSTSIVPADIFLSNQDKSRIYRVRVMLPGAISCFQWSGDRWR